MHGLANPKNWMCDWKNLHFVCIVIWTKAEPALSYYNHCGWERSQKAGCISLYCICLVNSRLAWAGSQFYFHIWPSNVSNRPWKSLTPVIGKGWSRFFPRLQLMHFITQYFSNFIWQLRCVIYRRYSALRVGRLISGILDTINELT
jgi:hypothetical protein